MPDPQRRISPQQLAANRANAANSTGPRTPEGKRRSAQNARKHGFTASTFAVVRLEDIEEVAHLREDLIALYQPVNSQELFALERAALAQQAILRGARLEAGFFTNCLDESFDATRESSLPRNPQLAGEIEITPAQDRNFVLAEGFHRLVRQSNSFALLLRYQAQSERLYRSAIEEFGRLRAVRDHLRNEPIPDAPAPEPEQTKPTCPACELAPPPRTMVPAYVHAHCAGAGNSLPFGHVQRPRSDDVFIRYHGAGGRLAAVARA